MHAFCVFSSRLSHFLLSSALPVRFQANKLPTFSSVFIRALDTDSASADASSKRSYSLCWAKADDRRVHSSRILKFSEISSVVVGKQCSVTREKQVAFAPERNCVSFISAADVPKKSLHLQFGNERDAETWAFGVASLMKEYGIKPAVCQAGQYKESEESKNKDYYDANATAPPSATPAAPAVTPVIKEEDDGSKPVEASDIESIKSMNTPNTYKIEISSKCTNLPSTHKNTIVCLVDRDERTNKLIYLNQSERISDTDSPVFKKKFPLSFTDTSAKMLRFNIYDVPAGQQQQKHTHKQTLQAEQRRTAAARGEGNEEGDCVHFLFSQLSLIFLSSSISLSLF